MKVKTAEEILDGLIPDQQIAKLAFLELEIYQRIGAMNEEEKVSLLVGYGFNVFGDESQQEIDDKLFEAVAASTIPRWELKKIAQDGKPCPKCGHELQEKSNAEDLMRWNSYYYCPSCGAEYTPSMLTREETQAARNRSALGNEDMDEDSLRENAQSEQGLLDKAWPVIQNMSDQQMTEILNRYGIESTMGISHEQLVGLMFESVENGQVPPEDLGISGADNL